MAKEQAQTPLVDEELEVSVDSEGRPQYEPKEIVLDGAPAPSKDGSPMPVAPALASPPEPGLTDEGAAELKRQLDVATQARQRAEQAARAERDRAIMAERTTIAVSSSAIDQAISAAQEASKTTKANIKAAMIAGDFDKAADLQEEMADQRANLLRLQEQKQYVEQQARMPPQRQEAPPPQPETDSLQRISGNLDQTGYPKSAAWIRAHPEVVANPKSLTRLEGAHDYAVKVKGLVPETPEYFALLEETLDMRDPEAEVREIPTPRTESRPAPRAAAPVSSSTPSLSGRTQRQSVRLSAAQMEHADVLGMTPEEYAREVMWAQDNNKLLGGARR